jgi:hypothetical protein
MMATSGKMNYKLLMSFKKTSLVLIAIPYILLIVFSMIILNTAFFTHEHILPDGTRISHAHPYQKNNKVPGEQQHNHSNIELMLLGQSNLYLLPDNGNTAVQIEGCCDLDNSEPIVNYLSQIPNFSGQRAPPVFFQ